jgi:CBS domain-containing protein
MTGGAVRVIEAVRRSAVRVEPDQTITEAAEAMNTAGIGALAVIDGDRLVGIVTDRDLVCRVLARRLPSDARVDSVMTMDVVTVDADADLHSTFGVFRSHAVRRLPVMRNGIFVGMIAIDDLLIDLAADLADLARPVTAEVLFPHADAEAPAPVPPR